MRNPFTLYLRAIWVKGCIWMSVKMKYSTAIESHIRRVQVSNYAELYAEIQARFVPTVLKTDCVQVSLHIAIDLDALYHNVLKMIQ